MDGMVVCPGGWDEMDLNERLLDLNKCWKRVLTDGGQILPWDGAGSLWSICLHIALLSTFIMLNY